MDEVPAQDPSLSPNFVAPAAPEPLPQVPTPPLPPLPPKTSWFKKHKRSLSFTAAVLVVALGSYWGYNYWQNQTPKHNYQEPVGLVSDKVSKSAGITINLPDSVVLSASEAKDKVSFDPALTGSWSNGQTARQLLFKPDKPLDQGKYYRVTLAAADVHLAKDFLADEDPQVVAIFPSDQTEAPENTEITIEFNRPMVPLTTLDEQAKGKIPVSILPTTSGKFKWATTRTLKFIPDQRLHRSSNYTVSVGSGFVSMDGLSVAPFEVHFTTRPLRYESDTIHHDGQTLYDEPVSIRFNQPVDLDKTKGQIEVKTQDGKNINFVAEYGTRTAIAGDNGKISDYTDKSVIYIYQAKDRFGRPKFWDSKSNYQVTINGATPLEGDIKLEESRSASVIVPDIVSSVTADSQRSNLAEASLFDPQGHLLITFFEDIDKDASKIKAKGLKSFAYGQQCKLDENGNTIYIGNSSDCQKEDNKKQLVLSFDDSVFKAGESFDVELSKIVNVKGLQLNAESLHEAVQVYPPLQVLSTVPAEGEGAASVTDLVICTNSPLEDAQPENFDQMLKSNFSVGKWNWDPAYKVQPQPNNDQCAVGQYENHIRYGLRPQAQYKLDLNLVDHFGQKTEKQLSFTSGKIDSTFTDFSALQKGYDVTTPQHTKLTYAATNLDYVNVQVCQVAPEVMLSYLDPDTQPAATTPGERLNCQNTWQKRVDLPPKYWTLNYFQINLSDIVPNPLGYYVLSFSNPQLREQVYNNRTYKMEPGAQTYPRTLINVTNLAAQEKKVEVDGGQEAERSVERKVIANSGGNLYWVTQIGSMDNVAGAQVQIYQKNKKAYVPINSVSTNNLGIARAQAYTGDGAAIISLGGDSTLVSALSDKFQWASSYRGGDKTYIYSDRPLYRPSQQVFIKGIYRIGYDGVYEIYQGKQAHLVVFNSKNEPVLTQDLDVSKNGSFNTTFNIPSDAPLGTYRVEALGGYYYFDVEEYKPAAFKLDINSDKDEYIAGDTFKLNVDANYYFGVPVEGGTVEYSILAQNYYFDRYSDQNFSFGSGWYYSSNPDYGDNFILRDKVDLNSKGQAQITQAIDFSKFFNQEDGKSSKIFVARLTVKNSTGQAVSGEKSFIVHRGEFYLGVNLQKPYFAKGESNKLMIKSVDTQGKEKGVSGITGSVNKITWTYNKRQEVDGGYYYNSEKKLDKVQDIKADTDGNGNYSSDFTVKDEGEYEIDIEAKDSRGNTVSATQEFYVYGSGVVQVQPLNNESLDLAVENPSVDSGGKGSVIIKSPYPKAKALVAIERGRIFDYQVIDVNSSFYNYTFDVKDDYVPNIYLTVLLLSPDPEVRFGQAQFFVNSKAKTISVEAKPTKNNYLPGEEVVMDVTTKDDKGNAVSADVSLSVADLSVLALVGNPKKDPVSFFYDGRPLGVTTASNIKNILQEADIPAGTKGGGGAEPQDLAAKKRGVFKDTAYWNADVHTGTDGHAQVKFTLPDNLTTWQVESLGQTDDTKLGVGYGEFTANKQLMVVPLIPRFVIPGDEFVIGGKVFNQTGSSQSLKITLDSPTLEITGSKETSVTLAAGETKSVYFKVKAPTTMQSGEHKINITAKNDKFTDSVDQTFPIMPDQTYEAVGTANYTTEASASEYVWLPNNILPNKGGVQIQVSATMAGVVPDALQYLVAYPYGCTEQMMSKLEAVATLKRLQAVKNLGDKFTIPPVQFDGQKYSADDVVSIGLARIMASQTPEGGFGYYAQMPPDYYLTLDVLNALEELRQAGYKVDDAAEARAVQYIYQKFVGDINLNRDTNTLILTAYTLNNVPSGSAQAAALMPRVLALSQNQKFFNEDISNLSLTYLALLTSNQSSVFNEKVFQTLENRVVVDGRGSYLGTGNSGNFWQYYETPIKDTALFIKAISINKRDYTETSKLLRWLKNSRSKDGSWGSTNNTVSVLSAIADYLQFKPETESNFALDVLVDGQSKGSMTFGGATVLDSLNVNLPISTFTTEKLSKIDFNKKTLNNSVNGLYYDMSLKYFLPVDSIAPRDEGFAVERELYALDDKKGTKPLSFAKVGDVLRGHMQITVTKPRNFVAIESFIPAGFELVNFNFATESQNVTVPNDGSQPTDNQTQPTVIAAPDKPVQIAKPGFFTRTWRGFIGLFKGKSSSPSTQVVADLPDEVYSNNITTTSTLYPDSTEYHDDRLMLFNQQLQPGVYEYDYYVRALIPGKFQSQPAVASELYLPENFGRSKGEIIEVKQ